MSWLDEMVNSEGQTLAEALDGPSPSLPERAERRVLARGWAMQAAAGEAPIPDPLRTTPAGAWESLGASFGMHPDQMREQWPCLRAVYVEIVESPPPEGGKEESRG
jgi:hypothetical protein